MSWELVTLPLNIPTAGTPVPISASRLLTKSVSVESDNTNAQPLYVGDSTVDAVTTPKRGNRLSKGEIWGMSIEYHKEYIDLSTIYIDTALSGQIAQVSYMKKL